MLVVYAAALHVFHLTRPVGAPPHVPRVPALPSVVRRTLHHAEASERVDVCSPDIPSPARE